MRGVFAAVIISALLTAGGATACLADDENRDPGAAPPAVPAIPPDEVPAASQKVDNKDSTSAGTTPDKTSDKNPGKTLPSNVFKFPSFKRAAAVPGAPPKPHVNLGLRVASTTVAGLCGIPIAMARHTKDEIVIATKELVDNSSNPWLLGLASPLGFVGGIVSGVSQGVVWGPLNAWRFSDQPFSAATFSIGPDAK
jgi:hypothetical protein